MLLEVCANSRALWTFVRTQEQPSIGEALIEENTKAEAEFQAKNAKFQCSADYASTASTASGSRENPSSSDTLKKRKVTDSPTPGEGLMPKESAGRMQPEKGEPDVQSGSGAGGKVQQETSALELQLKLHAVKHTRQVLLIFHVLFIRFSLADCAHLACLCDQSCSHGLDTEMGKGGAQKKRANSIEDAAEKPAGKQNAASRLTPCPGVLCAPCAPE